MEAIKLLGVVNKREKVKSKENCYCLSCFGIDKPYKAKEYNAKNLSNEIEKDLFEALKAKGYNVKNLSACLFKL